MADSLQGIDSPCGLAPGEGEWVYLAGLLGEDAPASTDETTLGLELCARLQPFQDRYNQAVAGGDTGPVH
ncbi:hypothetical protein [Streptomyces sp. NPDC093111]|uniref:hypothetical protein n=1 Tax=Streptomyces sp. NPDC093111 TaxID=3154978 RepID=UPI00343ACAB6